MAYMSERVKFKVQRILRFVTHSDQIYVGLYTLNNEYSYLSDIENNERKS